MTFISYTQGKVYDPAHLRPFDLGLAKQWHPICTVSGREVRLLREASKLWAYDEWYAGIGEGGYWGTCIHQKETYFENNLRLAPLAVKDGKPLHVGDWIEENYSQPLDEEPSCELPIWASPKPAYIGLNYEWRWPAEVKS
jgi:hypothetical protein